MSDELVDVLAAYQSEFWDHKVVSVDEDLQEELNALLAYVEMARVQILDDAVEDRLWHSSDFNQSKRVASLLNVLFRNFTKAI